MSIDKFTSRGFGASGASGRSSWSAPRDSYKTTTDGGSSFLFGGSGLRGSPTSGAQHKSIPSGGVGLGSEATRFNDEHGSSQLMNGATGGSRKLDLSGGDVTTTKLQRIMLLGGLVVAAFVFSILLRIVTGGLSDTSWVREHRSHVNSGPE